MTLTDLDATPANAVAALAGAPADVLAWLASKRAASTRAAYRRGVGHWLAYCTAAGVDWRSARQRHVDVWREVMTRDGLAAATIAQRLAAVSSLYTYLVREAVVERNPAEAVERPVRDVDHAETPALDEREAAALMAAASRPRESLTTKVGVGILLTMCLRISELDAADVEDLGVEQGQRILTLTRKGGKRQKIAMPATVWHDLEQLLDGRGTGPLLATRTGRRIGRRAWHRTVRRLASAADIPPETAEKIGPHALRRTGATALLDADEPLHDVQDLLGHADPRTTQRYNRSRKRLEKQARHVTSLAVAFYPEVPDHPG